MAILNQIIPAQNFEVIRDRIPVILVDELSNQATLTGNPDLNADVWSERIIPFDAANMPAVNILLSRGTSNFFTAVEGVYIYTYFVDVYTKAKSTDGERGGHLASIKLHRLLGVIRAILENPSYRTLGFPMPSLEHTAVTDIAIADPKNSQDANSVMMGRLTFTVQVRETTQLITPVDIAQSNTGVTIDETDEGYLYSYVAP
jgi:hypothetical protein